MVQKEPYTYYAKDIFTLDDNKEKTADLVDWDSRDDDDFDRLDDDTIRKLVALGDFSKPLETYKDIFASLSEKLFHLILVSAQEKTFLEAWLRFFSIYSFGSHPHWLFVRAMCGYGDEDDSSRDESTFKAKIVKGDQNMGFLVNFFIGEKYNYLENVANLEGRVLIIQHKGDKEPELQENL
uniref:AlNc14C21G2145 protein n=1 Tax=Albugo laibachii Nc14 TaxID=890382 RepID=F0W5I0_9STRA|nr:AlNc14C21G2145 [Albugo laibachii Nc14]|eukprot:CCA16371.1 AlNc14C21G2145 [Albugo laibachii Nc14]